MAEATRSLVVIPARGGSKRLPGKNLLDLAGKPLIAHTIEAALKSDCFTQVLVSSDNEDIRTVATQYDGVEVDARAPGLAGDTVKVVDVIADICSRESVMREFDAIAMMLPTAPFRRVTDVRSGQAALTDEVDAVISLAPYEFPPQMAVTMDDAEAIISPIFDPCPLISGDTRSQDQATAYRPNGSFYLSWIDSFRRLRSFFTGRVRGVAMSRLGSVDIDDANDMTLARTLVQAGLAPSDTL